MSVCKGSEKKKRACSQTLALINVHPELAHDHVDLLHLHGVIRHDGLVDRLHVLVQIGDGHFEGAHRQEDPVKIFVQCLIGWFQQFALACLDVSAQLLDASFMGCFLKTRKKQNRNEIKVNEHQFF